MLTIRCLLLSLSLGISGAAAEPACPACPDCPSETRDTVRRSGAHGLINPILDVESSIEFKELRPFKYKVQALIEQKIKVGAVSHVSVYFRDLENGPLFGFNEKEMFSPASMMKVPLLMAAMRRAAQAPAFLSRRVRYEQEQIVDAATLVPSNLEPGKEYTLEELVQAMITTSDNHAAIAVYNAVGREALDQVYRDLSITIPKVRGPGDDMTVREYATFFRILYNAAYLDKDRSQKALEFLSESEFKDGLVAGVPPEVVVAHKFGERSFVGSKVRQLHDCGIIYYKPQPYVLCVMTRGEDPAWLAGVVKDISRLVYAEVSSQAKP